MVGSVDRKRGKKEKGKNRRKKIQRRGVSFFFPSF
jgi:hypothetical protein